MPVIPEFNPTSAPGAGFVQSQSLMMQGLANRRAEESAEMERQKFEILRPVLDSEARLKLVENASGLAVTKQMNDYTTAALHEFPAIVNDWNQTSGIADPKERIAARREVLGRATPLAALKQLGPVVQEWQKQFADDAIADRTADTLTSKVDIASAGNDAKMAVAEKNLQAKQAALDLRQQQFEMQQQHAKEMEAIKAQHAQELQTMKADSAEKIATSRNSAAAERPKEAAALKVNEAALQAGNTATAELSNYQKAAELLSDPAIRTGTGAEFLTAANRLGEALGLPIDPDKVKNMEQLQGLLGSTLLGKTKQLQGSLSDKDVAVLKSITPNIGRSNEGNLAMLGFLMAQKTRDLEVAKLVQEGRRNGEPERQIQLEVNDFIQQTPLTVFQPALGRAAAPASGLNDQERARLQELRAKLGK